MSEPGGAYRKTHEVRWADLDANRHVRDTAYFEAATHTRFSCLAERGFPRERFERLGIGPVVFGEEARFRREIGADDTMTIDFQLAGFSADGSRWRLHHDVVRGDGVRAAVLRLDGAWMDLRERRLVRPPDELRAILAGLPRTHDFEELRSVVKEASER